MPIMNPAYSAKRQLLGDLLLLADGAALDVQSPNGAALAGCPIDKSPIADLLGAHATAVSGAELAVHGGILARAAAALEELRALPLMIEEPAAPPPPPMSPSEPPPAPPMP